MAVLIVDYGMGNLWSIKHAFEYLGEQCVISSDPKAVADADQIVLPGVGAFGEAMKSIDDRNLVEPLCEAVLVRQRKLLGICLGMQLLSKESAEGAYAKGLGFIDGQVVRFSKETTGNRKIPHIGFNDIEVLSASPLFSNLEPYADFYFVHSFHLELNDERICAAKCDYGLRFTAAIQYENIFATQFHPEKSQTNGLKLLKNFLDA